MKMWTHDRKVCVGGVETLPSNCSLRVWRTGRALLLLAHLADSIRNVAKPVLKRQCSIVRPTRRIHREIERSGPSPRGSSTARRKAARILAGERAAVDVSVSV